MFMAPLAAQQEAFDLAGVLLKMFPVRILRDSPAGEKAAKAPWREAALTTWTALQYSRPAGSSSRRRS